MLRGGRDGCREVAGAGWGRISVGGGIWWSWRSNWQLQWTIMAVYGNGQLAVDA